MDYIFTFDDGSTAYLEHYGVQGMKWGVRKASKYASAGNGTYYKKASHGSKYGKSVTDLRRAYNANQPKAKQIAKNILLTPGGAHAYNTARSRGLGRSESLQNASLGVLYAQGVKHKQKKLGTTQAKVSKAAKERSDYTRNESIGKSAAKTFLFGQAGSTAYNTVKARTKNRGKAAIAALGGAVGSYALGPAIGTAGTLAATRSFGKGNPRQMVNASNFQRNAPKKRKK